VTAHPTPARKLGATTGLVSARAWRLPAIRHRLADVHLLLAFALAITTLAAEIAAESSEVGSVALLAGTYLAVQVALARPSVERSRGVMPLARLLIDIAFVSAVGLLPGGIVARPIGMLYLPIVTLAAAIGRRETLVAGVGGIALALFLLPRVIDPVASHLLVERTVILVGTALFLAIGTRRTVASLERARDRARRAMSEDRRRGRQLAGLETVGRLLAHAGPTPEALAEVMDVLHDRFSYDYPSIYLLEGDLLRLGAQRGYDHPLHEIPANVGVVGRVVRSGELAYVPDVRQDPDYLSADGDIESEISVPVKIHDDVVGVLNVESTAARRLDETDVASMILVADRLASALALARERDALARRAELFERLTTVAARLSASLEPGGVATTIAGAFADVVATDYVTVIALDPGDGEYRVTALTGGDERFVGTRIQPGEGMAGRAILERRPIVEQNFTRSRFPAAMQSVSIEAVSAAAVPLIFDDDVVGAVSLVRADATSRFSALELEVLPLLALQAAVALRNAHLMTAVREASVRDPLTGLYNRRHFDASVDRLIAARRRLEPAQRQPVAAILFDLDRFGALNKRYGHAAGDSVLRAFAGILRDRFRASDIVARFGGEEFVVILDGATRDDAVIAADQVRTTLAALPIEAPGGAIVWATVSAGCALLAEDATGSAALLEVADVGLVMAKQAGRNQVVAA
jgi:diguanylate cyclase (GGDEF)-like protein